MPIPDFDHNGVLPPHIGNPAASPSDLSPYSVTTLEICQRWGMSKEREEILAGLIELRAALRQVNITTGFQWLDGSFLEDCESVRGSRPKDIDVVTYYYHQALPSPLPPIFPTLVNRVATKAKFRVDHILVCLNWPPETLIDQCKYWFGLFTHRKADQVWKGMLRIELGDDSAALAYLQSLKKP